MDIYKQCVVCICYSHPLKILLATDTDGNTLDLAYWCNRSGTLATTQFPLITALGTKNNIISGGTFILTFLPIVWLSTVITGISYDKASSICHSCRYINMIRLIFSSTMSIAWCPELFSSCSVFMQAARSFGMRRTCKYHTLIMRNTHRRRFQPYLSQSWLICGIIAIVALIILCAVSLRPIRAQAYELFFYVHFAMVL